MIDDLLRTAVRDLADESGTPHGLAAGALARGRRIRRTRRAAATAAALAVVLAATLPFVIHRLPGDEARPLPAAPVTTAPAREFDQKKVFTGPGGALLLGYGERLREFVTEPAGGYRELPAGMYGSEPSPDGRHVAVRREDSEKWTLLTLGTDTRSDLSLATTMGMVWSPDSRRLLATHDDGFSVVDPGTGEIERHVVDAQQMRCLDYCGFTWLAGGDEVALPQAVALNSEEARITGLAIFDARTGALLRNLPIKGAPVGRNAWSPDTTRVLVASDPGSTDQVTIVDVATQRDIARFTATWSQFLADGTVLAQRGRVLTRYDPDGVVLEKTSVPSGLLGKWLVFGF